MMMLLNEQQLKERWRKILTEYWEIINRGAQLQKEFIEIEEEMKSRNIEIVDKEEDDQMNFEKNEENNNNRKEIKKRKRKNEELKDKEVKRQKRLDKKFKKAEELLKEKGDKTEINNSSDEEITQKGISIKELAKKYERMMN